MTCFHGPVLTTARILAATLLTSALAGAGAVTLVTGPPAYAALEPSCTDVGVPTQTRQAQAVFTGEVRSVTTGPAEGDRRGVELVHEVAVDQVYKAARVDVPAELQVVTTRGVPGACNLGRLAEGEQVVFFVRAQTDEDGQVAAPPVFVASGDSGTAVADADLLDAVERILPNPTTPVPADPAQAEFEPLPVDEPAPLSRAVAPGAALVVAGLLGLFVVRRLNRR